MVQVQAQGTDNFGSVFERTIEKGFHVYATMGDADADIDMLPDFWEVYYGSDPNSFNRNADMDQDGLVNLQELRQGTHPQDPDTDNDGELDGSEFAAGRCPHDPADGAILAPIDVEVLPFIPISDAIDSLPPQDRSVLRFPWRSNYDQMRIFRAVDTEENFALLQALDGTAGSDGNYEDTAVEPGRTYFYHFQAVGMDGSTSRVSKTVSATIPTPSLEITREPGQVSISWEGEGFNLEDNTNLTESTQWSQSPETILQSNDTYSTQAAPTNRARYWRLKAQ
jgi:hypothetical protein